MARKKRYLLRDSDRSGFTYKDIELVSDNGFLVGGDEFDAPPPSNRLHPGEGDVSPGDTRLNYTSYRTDSGYDKSIQTVTASGGISLVFLPDNSNFQINNPISAWMYIQGSTGVTTITKNPQISSGTHGDKIALECVGSSVVISNNNGVQLYTNAFLMDSGSILNLIYNATDGLWHETSRGHRVKDLLGAF